MLDSTKKTVSTLFPPHPREAYRASHLQEERTSREDIEVLCAEAVLSQMGTRCHHRARVRKDFQTDSGLARWGRIQGLGAHTPSFNGIPEPGSKFLFPADGTWGWEGR